MKTRTLASAILAIASLSLLSAERCMAHLSYTGRDFGIFSDSADKTFPISGQIVSGNYGWADGTDADFGDSHKLKIFRFTLEDPMLITISVQGGSGLLPGFSLYSGLAHLSPNPPDHDGAAITLSYLDFIGGGKEGAFNALSNWRLGYDGATSFSQLTTFMFEGYAVDGTPANFGPAPGVVGDGLADGFVTKTFPLLAGDYSLFVGGADYAGTSASNYSISVSVSNVAPVPEPSTSAAFVGGLATLCGLRRRKS